MKSRTKKVPSFLLARLSLYLVGAATACFGVVGWYSPEPDVTACVLMVLTGLSALVVPFNIEIVGRARASVLVLVPALVFGAVNAYSVHHAVGVKIEEPRRMAHVAEVIAPKQAALDTAKAAVVAHVAPVFPDTMGPKNIAARMDAWRLAHAPLTEAMALAQAEFDAAPAHVPLVPDIIVWAISAAIDLSLAFGLAGISLVRGRLEEKAKAERPKRKIRKPAKAPVYSKPRLVASKS